MKEKIVEILGEINEEILHVGVEDDLLSSDLIDSFDIVNIVAELEEVFDIEINGDEIVEENFSTISKIAGLVEHIIQGRK